MVTVSSSQSNFILDQHLHGALLAALNIFLWIQNGVQDGRQIEQQISIGSHTSFNTSCVFLPPETMQFISTKTCLGVFLQGSAVGYWTRYTP